MKESYRKLLVLTIVFLSAFLVVAGIRKLTGTVGLLDFIKNTAPPTQNGNVQKATLAEDPPIKVSEIPLLQQINQEYAMLAEAVMPSVVSIQTSGVEGRTVIDRFGQTKLQRSRTSGQGSGVIVSYEGHIITNYHVVSNKQQIEVIGQGNRSYRAEIIGTDPMLDIAVLKINSNERFKPLKFGDSDKVREGNVVLAFGNPFEIGKSVTNGVISARERSLTDKQGGLLQSSAAVNPGYSGGPLVNTKGEIIGINSSIYSSDQKNPGFQGISFSIPSNIVKRTFEDIRMRGRPVRGFLGVSMKNLTPTAKQVLDYTENYGALIDRVGPNTPASRAGIKRFDIIMEYNHQKVRDYTHLIGMIQRTEVGNEIPISIWREQKKVDLTTTITEYDSSLAQLPVDIENVKDPGTILKAIGIEVTQLSGAERRQGHTGVKVHSIIPNSQAEGLLQPGDIIVLIDKYSIHHPNQFYSYLVKYAVNNPVNLTVYREESDDVIQVMIQPLNQK